MSTAKEIMTALDGETVEHRLLEHPFYRAWSAGTLTIEDLAFYAGQYWRQVEAFPGYLQSLHDRLPDGDARSVVEENLRDERDDDHPALWLEFARALGLTVGEVRAETPEAETLECVKVFSTGAASESLPYALGMLYAYESQTPAVAETKIEGLRRHYGIEGPGTEYFALHGELDIEHSADLARALECIVDGDSDLDEARRGARAGASAVYGLLTGVTRARAICA